MAVSARSAKWLQWPYMGYQPIKRIARVRLVKVGLAHHCCVAQLSKCSKRNDRYLVYTSRNKMSIFRGHK
jgi:hypothetical protein